MGRPLHIKVQSLVCASKVVSFAKTASSVAGIWIGRVSVYAYAYGNPLTYRDPSGLVGIGLTLGDNIEAGAGSGFAYQSSVGGGLFASNFWGDNLNAGGYVASGGFLGGYATLAPFGTTPNSGTGIKPDEWVIGASAGVGVGFFLTNADNADQLIGPFDTWTLNLPLISFQLAYDGNVFTFGASVGRSLGFDLSRYQVITTAAKTYWNAGCPQ